MPRLLQILRPAVLLLLIIGLQVWHFSGQNYRQDEAWVVHGVMERTWPQMTDWVISLNTDPPGWNFALKIWVGLVGHLEAATRHSSALFTVLGLSFLYRLVADGARRDLALYSVFALGTLSFFQFFAHEVRPYAALICWTLGMHWAFNRWLRQRRIKYALLFLLCGVLALYTHYFAALYVAGLAAYLALFVPWYRRAYWPLIGYFALLTAALGAWVAFIIITRPFVFDVGISYGLSAASIDQILGILYEQMQPRPAALGMFLLISGIIVPLSVAGSIISQPMQRWNPIKLQALVMTLAILIVGLALNDYLRILTPRNAIIILPLVSILIGAGLLMLDWRARTIAMILLLIPAATDFVRHVANGPYREINAFIAAQYESGDAIMIDASQGWQHIPLVYYLEVQANIGVDNADFTHFAVPQELLRLAMPEPAQNWIDDDEQIAEALITEPQRIWWIEVAGGTEISRLTRQMLDQAYIATRFVEFAPPDWDWAHTVVEYRRVPDDVQLQYRFDDQLEMHRWQVDDVRVRACGTILLESWWQLTTETNTNYSITLVLADEAGSGIANVDSSPAGVLTGLWEAGRYYLDERSLSIPCDLPAGTYPLLISAYDTNGDGLAQTVTATGEAVTGLVYLTNIIVED